MIPEIYNIIIRPRRHAIHNDDSSDYYKSNSNDDVRQA